MTDDTFYKNYFDLKSYEKHKKQGFLIGQTFFNNKIISDHFPKQLDAKIIDIACGYGALVNAAMQKGYTNIVGVDISDEMVAIAKQLEIQNVIKHDIIDFLKDQSTSSVDVVVAIDIFEHLDTETFLLCANQINRVLKANGKLISQQPNGGSPFVGGILFGDITHERAYTPQSLTQVLKKSGFNQLKFYEVAPVVHNVKSSFRRLAWHLTVRPLLQYVLAVESGTLTGQTLTRNFVCVAQKQLRPKLGIFALHPIQYQSPIFKCIEDVGEIETMVYYGDDIGLVGAYQKEFDKNIVWDIPLLSGFQSQCLKNFTLNKFGGFFKRINPSLLILIPKNNFDYFLVHGHTYFSSWIVLLACLLTKTKLLYRGEAIPRDESGIKRKIKDLITKFYFARCAHFFYSCSENKKYFLSQDVPEEKLSFLKCSVDNTFFQKSRQKLLPNRREDRLKLGFSDDDLVIVFVARLVQRKQPLFLLQAVKELKNPNVKIIYVGDGPLSGDLKEQIGKNTEQFKLAGFVNQSGISHYYNISDVFYINSIYDASPKSLNEAMNFGLPSIASKKTGTAPDLLLRENAGFVVDSGDKEALKKSITTLFEDKKTRYEMGGNARRVIASWCPEQNADVIISQVQKTGR